MPVRVRGGTHPDPRAGFLLSFVDGSASVAAIIDVTGMATSDATRLVEELLAPGVIRLR